jgi:hypothetical protein
MLLHQERRDWCAGKEGREWTAAVAEEPDRRNSQQHKRLRKRRLK